jgi:hypothetical protein
MVEPGVRSARLVLRGLLPAADRPALWDSVLLNGIAVA